MKNNTTLRALLVSLLSLLICFSMLIGSTFAWFTDKEVTGVNTITAGNLDIELQYSYNMTAWTDADNKTDIFKSENWEPGVTQVVYFKVSNEGSLAAKYQFGINLVNNTTGLTSEGEVIDLTKFIKFGIVENVTAKYTTREEAVSAVKASAVNFGSYCVGERTLEAFDDTVIAMVVYMPSSTGNEANHDGENVPSIQFGVSVVATQAMSESDGFNNEYDEKAAYPEFVQVTYKPEQDTVLEGQNVNAVIPAESVLTPADGGEPIPADTNVILAVEPTSVNSNITVEEGSKVETYEVSLKTEDGTKLTSDKPIDVTMNIGAGRTGAVQLYHNETPIDSTYNAINGELTFTTNNFSPFTVVEEAVVVDVTATVETFASAVANAADGAVIGLEAGTYTVPKFSGKTITITGTKDTVIDMKKAIALNDATVILDGVTVEFDNDNYEGFQHTTKVVYKNCHIIGKQHLYAANVGFFSCTIENKADYSVWTYGASNVNFTDCTFISGGKAVLVFNESTTDDFVANISFNNCVFNDDDSLDTVKGAVELGDTPYGSNTYNITFNGCTVNGFAENDEGLSTNSVLWGNKDSMDKDHLNVVINGTDVY